ncbi:MAG: prepilin peptidase [Lachnospiraceae bacterium]|nr:prepilin peptidase [Lachnospiraceae bacterium]
MGKFFLFFLLLSASCTDISRRYVDNLLLLAAAFFAAAFALADRGLMGLLDGFLVALLVFMASWAFFIGGLLGAGDIKFLMVLGLYMGSAAFVSSLAPIAVSSVLFLLLLMIRHRRIRDIEVPMTVPISLGVLYVMG